LLSIFPNHRGLSVCNESPVFHCMSMTREADVIYNLTPN
jgi:hypothetical protein